MLKEFDHYIIMQHKSVTQFRQVNSGPDEDFEIRWKFTVSSDFETLYQFT